MLGGSFSPPHAGHVAALEAGRANAEQDGFRVVAGYFAVAHNGHVRGKLRGRGEDTELAFHVNDRLRMCNAVAASTSWLRPTTSVFGSAQACGKAMVEQNHTPGTTHVMVVRGGNSRRVLQGGTVAQLLTTEGGETVSSTLVRRELRSGGIRAAHRLVQRGVLLPAVVDVLGELLGEKKSDIPVALHGVSQGQHPCAIFLDVDGVLSPFTLRGSDPDAIQVTGAPAALSRSAVHRLVQLVTRDVPGCLVVVSSDWRLDPDSYSALLSVLEDAGMPHEKIVGRTRITGRHRVAGGANRRVYQILDWLERSKVDEAGPRVDHRWVAIDDLALAAAFNADQDGIPGATGEVGGGAAVAGSGGGTAAAEVTVTEEEGSLHFVRTAAREGLTPEKCDEVRRKLQQLLEVQGDTTGAGTFWCLHDDCVETMTSAFDAQVLLDEHWNKCHTPEAPRDIPTVPVPPSSAGGEELPPMTPEMQRSLSDEGRLLLRDGTVTAAAAEVSPRGRAKKAMPPPEEKRHIVDDGDDDFYQIQDAYSTAFPPPGCHPNKNSSSSRGGGNADVRVIQVQLVSFGYSYGAAKDTVRNFDARSLPDPAGGKQKGGGDRGREYRGPTGLQKRLRESVVRGRGGEEFCEHVEQEILTLAAEAAIGGGAGQGTDGLLRFGVGCRGGKHRSVSVVEEVSGRIGDKDEHLPFWQLQVLPPEHRDISKPLR